MCKLIIILCLLALPIFAQQPAPEVTPEQYKQGLQVIIAQRNALSTNLLDIQAQLQIVAQENEALKKELAELKAKVADAAKPKAEGVAKTEGQAPQTSPKS